MEANKNYISRTDYNMLPEVIKNNKHIDFCLKLIKKLIDYNSECKAIVGNKHDVPNYIIDYRIVQFDLYENILKCIYYNCFSLKYVYDISTYMGFKEIKNTTIGNILEQQRKHVTFSSIVMIAGIFEDSRKEFEQKKETKNYFKDMEKKYPVQTKLFQLLNDFRNTVHSNGKTSKELSYKTRSGTLTIKKGEVFQYDHWLLYRIIRDSIELHKLLALDNEAAMIRRANIAGVKNAAVLRTSVTMEDWDRLARNAPPLPIE